MQGSNDSTAKVYLAHRRALVDYATPIVGDRARAEDIVQEAFLKFAPTGQAGMHVEQPLAYLYRIVRNLALDWTRRAVVEDRQQKAGPAWWMVPAAAPTPEQDASHRERLRHVREVLETLPADTRLAVEMHRLGGYTLQEVADHLGVSVPTVHRMVRDALMQIAKRLTPPDK